MAEIRNYGVVRHLRAEPSSHVLKFRNGRLQRSGRGLSFWFLPLSASLAEIPVDDREVAMIFHGRTADFQDVTAQGVVGYRVGDPLLLAERVDFSIDPRSGRHLEDPLSRLATAINQRAEQHAWSWIARTPVREVLAKGHERIREQIAEGLTGDESLSGMGLTVVSVRVSSVRPTPDLEKALEAPTREQIQQAADEAAFSRRALAVEKERAIQENELQNRIELSRREEDLIAQQGQNARRRAAEEAAARRVDVEGEAARARIEADAAAERQRIAADATAAQTRVAAAARADEERMGGDARAHAVRAVEAARVEAERDRMEIHRDLPPALVFALAAQELATKLRRIEHLNVAPEMFGPVLTDLIRASTKKLDAGGG